MANVYLCIALKQQYKLVNTKPLQTISRYVLQALEKYKFNIKKPLETALKT